MTSPRIALYVRVSSASQVQTQTIDQQITRLTMYCDQHDWAWTPDHLFRDDGYSGSRLTRPGLERLRAKIAQRQIDRILITTPDRLARKYLHQMLLLEEWEQAGCQIIFLDQPFSRAPNDQLMVQIRGAVAEYERTLITERLRQGRRQKYRAGALLPWTTPPYGYTSDPDRPRDPAGVCLQPLQAPIVADMFARYVQPGQSLSHLAKWLMSREIPAPQGGPRWSVATVRAILTNPVYAGTVYAGRSQPRDTERRRSPLQPTSTNGRRAKQPLPPSEWILVGTVPAIVAQPLFDQVQAKLATNQKFARRNARADRYLLRALVSCGVCRYACNGQTSKGRYSYYTCAGKYHSVENVQEQRCPTRTIPMNPLDAVVWQDVCSVLTTPGLVRAALVQAQQGAWMPQEFQARRKNLHTGISAAERQLTRLTDAYLAEIIGLEEYGRRRQDLESQRSKLQQTLALLDQQAATLHTLEHAIKHMEVFCQRIAAGLAEATFEQRRHVVELLIDRVIVTNDTVEIRYVIPTTLASEHTIFSRLRSDHC
jgi:site-specific DNA recombinase